MASKSLRKVRRTQNLGPDRLITLINKQGREINDQDKIIEQIEEFYTELSEQSTSLVDRGVPYTLLISIVRSEKQVSKMAHVSVLCKLVRHYWKIYFHYI